LWLTPPHIGTPFKEKKSAFLKMHMTKKLMIAPARLNKIPNILPNKKPETTILSTFIISACCHPYKYNTISIAALGSPSFIPGIPKAKGIRDSTYDKIRATPRSNPRLAALVCIVHLSILLS
jgi:hypothetical protein